MKTLTKEKIKTNNLSKKVTVGILFVMSAAIAISGVFFMVYSYINNISFKVINTDVSGIIFGLVVFYLGLRYFLMVGKLKKEVYGTNSKFSWSNFKPKKRFFAKSR